MEKENNKMELAKPAANMLNKMVGKIETLEAAVHLGKFIIDSGFAPKHYKEQPNAAASVVMAIQMGAEIGFSPVQAMQEIVFINGLIALKGDGAKALIMQSGLCKSWEEKETGSLEDGTLCITITSTRKDNAETLSRSFSIKEAKKADLWISDEDVKRDPKKRYSPWHKYQRRMLHYRALGFLVRDLYPDIMKGCKTEEEAMDYQVVDIPHEEVAEARATSIVTEAKAAMQGNGKAAIRKMPATEAKPAKPAAENKQSAPEQEDKGKGNPFLKEGDGGRSPSEAEDVPQEAKPIIPAKPKAKPAKPAEKIVEAEELPQDEPSTEGVPPTGISDEVLALIDSLSDTGEDGRRNMGDGGRGLFLALQKMKITSETIGRVSEGVFNDMQGMIVRGSKDDIKAIVQQALNP